MRRGQAWSVDLVIGVLIFLLVLGLFYAILSTHRGRDTTELKVASEIIATKLVSSQELAIVIDDTVNKQALIAMAEKARTPSGYNELKLQFGIDTEFCIFFEDENGNLVNISDGTRTYAGIGPDNGELNLSGSQCGARKDII